MDDDKKVLVFGNSREDLAKTAEAIRNHKPGTTIYGCDPLGEPCKMIKIKEPDATCPRHQYLTNKNTLAKDMDTFAAVAAPSLVGSICKQKHIDMLEKTLRDTERVLFGAIVDKALRHYLRVNNKTASHTNDALDRLGNLKAAAMKRPGRKP